jgi:NhaA family Na+:H+ antiporter
MKSDSLSTPVSQRSRAADALRGDTTGGVLLITAALVALMWANSQASPVYEQLRDIDGTPVIGPRVVRAGH